MVGTTPEDRWLREVLLRATLAGAAIGVVALAGSAVVLRHTSSGIAETSVLIATVLLSVAVGLWAGAPEAGREKLRLRDGWLAAAALTAVGGSFAAFWTLYQQIYPGAWWRIAGLVIVVAAPLYALGMLFPVLLAWAERWLEVESEEERGWGALAPVVIGVLGGSTAGVLLGAFLLGRWSPGSAMMIAAAGLLLPLVLPEPDRELPRERVLEEVRTPFGSLRVTEVAYPGERQPERRLYLNEEEESGELARSGAPTLAYVAAAESWLASETPRGASFLFLGGGAYTLPRRIAERDPKARITVVELDPEVTRLAYRYFNLKPHHGISSVHGDARAYLRQAVSPAFDRVYVDVYGGGESLPFSMVTTEAAQDLRRLLRPGGIGGLNLIGTVVGEESVQLWSIVQSYAEVFPDVGLYTHLGRDFPDRQNLLLAVAEGGWTPPRSAGRFDFWPHEEWPRSARVTIFRDIDTDKSTLPAARAESA